MKRFIICLVVLCVTNNIVYAIEFPLPVYPVDIVESKEFVVEHVYRYYLHKYRQPLILNYVKKEDVDFTSPELAVVALLSAINSSDIQSFLDAWDGYSRDELAANLSVPENAAAIKQGWKDVYENSQIYLLNRIERKEFVILEYVIKKENSADLVERINIAQENGKWKATNKYSKDVISNYATSTVSKIRLPGE